jgi:hypothetical protein
MDMKKIFFLVTTICLGLVASFVGCKKEQSISNYGDNNKLKKFKTTNLSYKEIGIMHNQSLSFAYQASSANPNLQFKDHINILIQSVANLRNFEGYDNAILVIDTITTKQGAADVLSKLKSEGLKDPFIKMVTDSVINIAVKINSIEDFDLMLSEYYSKNVSKYTGTELVKFNNIIGVASGSFNYWNANIDLWSKLNIPGHIKNPPSGAYLTKGQKWLLFGLSDLCSAWCVPLMAISSGLVAYSWD